MLVASKETTGRFFTQPTGHAQELSGKKVMPTRGIFLAAQDSLGQLLRCARFLSRGVRGGMGERREPKTGVAGRNATGSQRGNGQSREGNPI